MMYEDPHRYNTTPLEQEGAGAIPDAEVSRQEEMFDLPVPLNLLQTSPFYGYDSGEDLEAADEEQKTTRGVEQQVHLPEPLLTFSSVASRSPFAPSLPAWLRRENSLRHLALLLGGAVLILGLSMGTAFAQSKMSESTSGAAAVHHQQRMTSTPMLPAKPRSTSSHNASPAPLAQEERVVAQDDFQNDVDATSWTTASDRKNSWTGDVGNGDFVIQSGIGLIAQVRNDQAKNGLYLTALLGPTVQNSTITVEMALRSYRPDLLANDGVVLRYRSPGPATLNQSQYYKAYLDGSHLVLLRKSGGVMTTLKSMPFQARAGQRYTLTLSAQGAQLVAQAWQTNSSTTNKVTIKAQDTTLASGQDGLRVLTQVDTQIQVYSVKMTEVQQPPQ